MIAPSLWASLICALGIATILVIRSLPSELGAETPPRPRVNPVSPEYAVIPGELSPAAIRIALLECGFEIEDYNPDPDCAVVRARRVPGVRLTAVLSPFGGWCLTARPCGEIPGILNYPRSVEELVGFLSAVYATDEPARRGA